MRYYTIEVDETIWNHLKSKAEPFEDTPNSVLHRLLFNISDSSKALKGQPIGMGDILPLQRKIPEALSQILEVIFEVKVNGRERSDATRVVAKKRGRATQTVLDKYCRQLNKKAYEIDELLSSDNLDEFRHILERKFQIYRSEITLFFGNLTALKSGRFRKPEQPKSAPRTIEKGGQMYGFKELKLMELGKKTRPKKFKIDGEMYHVHDWAELSVCLVKHLLSTGKLKPAQAPIFSYSSRQEKYLISRTPRHFLPEKDAEWKQVGPLYVDVKYNAEAHFKNVVHLLRHLRIDNPDFAIEFR